MAKAFNDLTKVGIVLFVLIGSMAGYALSFPIGAPLDIQEPILLLVGLYLVSGGSFAINQAQEWRMDKNMPRTKDRPVASGLITPWQAYVIGGLLVIFGTLVLLVLNPLSASLAIVTLLFYNGFYTLIWKRRWAFGAVPGAIPGAMPAVIGFSVNDPNIFSSECLYIFLIMFLWQMPHFWCIAIRFKEDYKQGGVPVLPVNLGVPRTLYHIGLYVFAYAGIAIASPWFLQANIFYLLLVLPI